jgi:succinate-semialdehyde dehydrogenase / glutarate-semialdehyde dehydrogenase
MPLEVVDPATGRTVRTVPGTPADQIDGIVERAHEAFLTWRGTPFDVRARLMRGAGAVLRERAGAYARLMAEEMGKPVRDGRAEAEKCAWVCEYYAQNAERFLADEPVETDASASFVAFRPLGVVLAVMPWNFPFWQVFRFAAPGLMAGNGGLLKHASNVPGCALAIEEVFREAGFPEGLFRALLVGSERVETLIEHPLVRAVTLTGSGPAGRAVAGAAGRNLKKTVLELGGSDPYVILGDAAKRFIVVEPVRETFERGFVERMARAIVGDPLDEATDVGPQARADLRDDLHRQVEETIALGARCLLGGQVPDREGAWYPPTVLTDVKPASPGYEEELFGPVASIIPVADEAEAIQVANDTAYGLGAAVFTGDLGRGRRIAAEELEAGACFVNELVKSDPRLPFGGIRESGYGRELSVFGIREFVNVKSVWIA